MAIEFYQFLHKLNDGFIFSKSLRNRGRLRHFFSNRITELMQEKLTRLIAGDLNLPSTGTTGLLPVSLTSWQPRFNSLPLVLLNLLEQDLLPPKIIVWLTHEDFEKLDPQIVKAFSKSIIEFKETRNFGPHKKWLPFSLMTDEPFIICDDDIFYPNNWYRTLVKSDDQRSCVAHRCHRISLSSNSSFLPYEVWSKDIMITNLSHQLFAVGCGGVLIYPDRISSRFRDWDLINKVCPRSDDIWLKFAHIDSGIPVKKTPYMFPCIEYLDSQSVGLMQTNVNQNGNDEQIKQSLATLKLNLAMLVS